MHCAEHRRHSTGAAHQQGCFSPLWCYYSGFGPDSAEIVESLRAGLGKVVVVLGVMQRQALWFRQCSTLSRKEETKTKNGKKVGKKGKDGPKGYLPEMGPKIDFSHKNFQEKS